MKAIIVAIPLMLTSASGDTQQAARTIEQQTKAFAEAFNDGRMDLLSAMYVDAATVLPPAMEMIKGRSAIAQYWRTIANGGMKNLVLNTVSVVDHGQVATEIGRFAVEAPDGAGTTRRVEGKYVAVWEKTDGAWKLATDIWNDSK